MPKVVTIFDRQREFESEGFYVFDAKNRIMMCKFCNARIDWQKKDTCTKHVTHSEYHKRKRKEARAPKPSTSGVKRQLSIADSINSGTAKKMKLQKEAFVCSTARAFMSSNIPLEKLDDPHLREWLNANIEGAGDLPCADTLREKYIPMIREERFETVSTAVKDQPIVIMCDETTDRKGQCVFVVLLRVLCVGHEQKVYVGGVSILENATAKECFRAISEVLKRYDIDYDNVIAITTDGARYMTLCAATLAVPSPDILHIQCWAHKLNLVSALWSHQLPELNRCVQNTKMVFLNTRKRKHRYISHLKATYPNGEKKALLFPSPVMTRWSSWYKSAIYLQDYLPDLAAFCKSLDEESAAVKYFQTLRNDEIKIIQSMATFLSDIGQDLIDTIETLEGSTYPYAHHLTVKVSDLTAKLKLVSDGHFGEKTKDKISELSNTLQKSALKTQLKNVGLKCVTKLAQLTADDPAKKFVQNMGILFNRRNVMINTVDERLALKARSIHLLASLTSSEFLEGYAAFQAGVESSSAGEAKIDIIQVLLGLREDFGKFVDCCVKALWVPVSNVDSERAFSAYGNILTDLRTNLKPENVELMLSLTFGTK